MWAIWRHVSHVVRGIEYESMLLMMSCSLSTVHRKHMHAPRVTCYVQCRFYISFRQHCGVEEGSVNVLVLEW